MTHAPLVLLVDDDPDFIQIHRFTLEAHGYRVASAPNPREALLKMAAERPQIVITDLMMNSFDAGFSLSRQIKGDPRYSDIPVIIVTAVSGRLGYDFRPQRPEDLASMHADAYFAKPVEPEALLEKLRELVPPEDSGEEEEDDLR